MSAVLQVAGRSGQNRVCLEVDVSNSCSLISGAGVTGRLQWEDPKLPQIRDTCFTSKLSNHIDQLFGFVLFTFWVTLNDTQVLLLREKR